MSKSCVLTIKQFQIIESLALWAYCVMRTAHTYLVLQSLMVDDKQSNIFSDIVYNFSNSLQICLHIEYNESRAGMKTIKKTRTIFVEFSAKGRGEEGAHLPEKSTKIIIVQR